MEEARLKNDRNIAWTQLFAPLALKCEGSLSVRYHTLTIGKMIVEIGLK